MSLVNRIKTCYSCFVFLTFLCLVKVCVEKLLKVQKMEPLLLTEPCMCKEESSNIIYKVFTMANPSARWF